MLKPKKEFRMTRFTVRGQGCFPYDMLRYDSCCPDTGNDAAVMADDNGPGRARIEPRTVTLRRYTADGIPAEAARWASFRWTVIADEGRGDHV